MKLNAFWSLLALWVVCGLLHAAVTIDLSENDTLTIGGDMRARWEFFDRTVVSPNGTGGANSPANQYLRIRTRFWMQLNLAQQMQLNLRLANRVHFVSSSPSDPNNQGTSTWKSPDEVYIDALNVVFWPSDNFTLTLGRQAFSFGNGMIFCDPTPFDQGRSAYTDGLSLKYKDDADTVTAFVTYDSWKDRTVFINDRNRSLRSGNVFTAGAYWTHSVSDAFKFDAYYIFNDLDDRHPESAERNHAADCSTSLHTFGGRVFGAPLDWLDYSLELAAQKGRNAEGADNCGKMADARLNFKLPVPEAAPVFGLEYTHFSGDKAGSRDSEGWNPLLAQAPLWGEELLPIMLNGNWTNLNLFRASLTVQPLNDLKASIAATECYSDETNGEGGHHQGLLLSGDAAYTLNENLDFHFQISRFNPGNAYDNGHNSIWGRFEITVKF